MVLLDLLRQKRRLELVVAHFEHGIRHDSDEDRKLVQRMAKHYDLPFVYARGHLGANASEALAREARYAFLEKVRQEQGARAVITAHHQDDMLETAVINLLRGTGRRGLSSLRTREYLIRPMLEYSKQDVRTYAEEHDLVWAEDSTNADDRYLRNYVRHNVLARFPTTGRVSLLGRIKRAGKINDEIDELLNKELKQQPADNELSRSWYLQLPYAVASEMMAAWLRRNGIHQFDRRTIDRLVVAAKTANPGKMADVNAQLVVQFTKNRIKLTDRAVSDER